MVQILPPKTDVFGDVGAALGQGFKGGLQEAMQGQLQKNRLVNALKNLPKGANTLETLTSFLEKGGTPEQWSQVEPYVRQGLLADRASQYQDGESTQQMTDVNSGQGTNLYQTQVQPSENPQTPIVQGPINIQNNPNAQQNAQTPSLVNPVAERAGLNTQLPASIPQIRQKQFQLMRSDPVLYGGPGGEQRALEDAQTILNQPLVNQAALQSQAQTQQAIENTVGNDLDQEILNLTQEGDKSGLNQVLTGEALQHFKNNTFEDIKKGTPKRSAIMKNAKDALEYYKKVVSLRNSIGSRGLTGEGSKDLYDSIRNYKNSFSKIGAEDLFRQELSNSLDISPHRSGIEAYDTSPQLEKSLGEIKGDMSIQDIAKTIAPHIGKKDSLWSVGYLLDKIGVNDKAVLNEISRLNQSGLINLGDRQERELAEYYSAKQNSGEMGDLLLDVLIPLRPVVRYVTGVKEKVGTFERAKRFLGK